jgi:predicted anti-sigma-YlaC factor YlaD
MRAIVDYLLGTDDPATLTAAVDMLLQRGSLPRLQAALTDTLACDACHSHLAEYALALELAQPLSPALRAVEHHLAQCEACRADYVALEALSRLAEAEDFAAVYVPTPDHAFLNWPAVEPVGSLWRQVEPTQHQLVTAIQVAISNVAAWFMAWPGGLTPQAAPTPVLRGEPERGVVQRLVLPATGDLSFELTITSSATHAQITLGVFQAPAHQPVSQIPVTLFNQHHQRLHRAGTNAAGLVQFDELPPGTYHLQVRTASGQWELAVVVQEAASGDRYHASGTVVDPAS